MQWVDGIASVAVWRAAVEKGIRDGKNISQAHVFADNVVTRTMGGSIPELQSSFFRNKSSYVKMVTLFKSAVNSLWNEFHDDFKMLLEADTIQDKGEAAYNMAVVILLPKILEMVIRGDVVWDDDEPVKSALYNGAGLISSPIAFLPIMDWGRTAGLKYIADTMDFSAGTSFRKTISSPQMSTFSTVERYPHAATLQAITKLPFLPAAAALEWLNK
jgi:hypothetical protein